jgi:hypothetical protein
LLPNAAEGERNARFLGEVIRAAGGRPVDAGAGSSEDLRDRNLFLIGVSDRDAARRLGNDEAAITRLLGSRGLYDYDFAQRFFRDFCRLVAERPAPCQDAPVRGPYVVTVVDSGGLPAAAPARYLLVGLSERDPREFRAHVQALLQQVKRRQFEDRAAVDALKLQVLTFLLQAGDAISLTNEAFAKIYAFKDD